MSSLYHCTRTTAERDGFALEVVAEQASRPEEKEESVQDRDGDCNPGEVETQDCRTCLLPSSHLLVHH